MFGIAFAAVLLASARDEAVSQALERLGRAESYDFKLEMTLKGKLKSGTFTAFALEGAYEKDRPVRFRTGALDLYRMGASLACEVKKEWRRVDGSGPGLPKVSGQASVARIRALVLPHEELPGIRKCFEGIRRLEAKEGDQSVYTGELTVEGAKRLFETDLPSYPVEPGESVSGSGRFWVRESGDLAMVEIIVRKKGNGKGRGAAPITVSKWITLGLPGAAKVEVPEAALRALEEK
ncbi:MAG: hypothetical protein L0170_06795 [Acidobacteria bacterium]|nr:hypothetical protein [Acidobacteriota bacterium]